MTYGLLSGFDSDIDINFSFFSLLQAELELIQRAYVDNNLGTLRPNC
jgi:hypothetical protein